MPHEVVLGWLHDLTRAGNRAELDWVWREAQRQYEGQVDCRDDLPNPLDCLENAIELLEAGYEGSPRSEVARLERFLDSIDSSPEARRRFPAR